MPEGEVHVTISVDGYRDVQELAIAVQMLRFYGLTYGLDSLVDQAERKAQRALERIQDVRPLLGKVDKRLDNLRHEIVRPIIHWVLLLWAFTVLVGVSLHLLIHLLG